VRTASSTAPVYLVRAGRQECSDRVVFHLNGPDPVGYSVRYAGSFEGQTTIAVGVRTRVPFRVFTMLDKQWPLPQRGPRRGTLTSSGYRPAGPEAWPAAGGCVRRPPPRWA
jgi:hypothetical protein